MRRGLTNGFLPTLLASRRPPYRGFTHNFLSVCLKNRQVIQGLRRFFVVFRGLFPWEHLLEPVSKTIGFLHTQESSSRKSGKCWREGQFYSSKPTLRPPVDNFGPIWGNPCEFCRVFTHDILGVLPNGLSVLHTRCFRGFKHRSTGFYPHPVGVLPIETTLMGCLFSGF